MASKIKVDQIEGSSGSTITIPSGQSFILTDGLPSASLPTVPTTKGGTGLTSLGSAGQVIKVNSGGSALEFGTGGGLAETGFEITSGSQTINSGSYTAVTHATFNKSLTSGQKIHLRVGSNGYLDVDDKTIKRAIYVTTPGGSATNITSLATAQGGMGASDDIYSWYWNNNAADYGYPPDATWVYEALTTGTHTFQLYVKTTGGTGNMSYNTTTFHYLITSV